MTQNEIAEMANKFLQWKLPSTFNPDYGISFNSMNGQLKPIGTNLFTCDEAKQMIEFILDGKLIEEKNDLLREYSQFLEENGYTDSDWRGEHPTSIERFLSQK